MKIFFFRTLSLLIFVFLQFSFFSILFPWLRAPIFLLLIVVSYTLVRGFPQSLFVTVPLTLLFDVVAFGAVSWFSFYAVLWSYGTSFLSRRILIEHRGIGLLLYGFVAYGGVLFYQLSFPFFIGQKDGASLSSLLSFMPSLGSLLFTLVVVLPLFFASYFVIQQLEKHLELMSQKQFRAVR